MKIILFTRKDGDIGVRLLGDNNRILMASEGYKRRASADNLVRILTEKLEGGVGYVQIIDRLPKPRLKNAL